MLDTGVLMAIARRKVSLDQALADDDDPAIAAITAAELLQGVERADGVHRVARQSFVDTVLATIPVEEHRGRGPRTRPAARACPPSRPAPRCHDLIIAATALTTARTVVSHDKRARFDDLPGVRVRQL